MTLMAILLEKMEFLTKRLARIKNSSFKRNGTVLRWLVNHVHSLVNQCLGEEPIREIGMTFNDNNIDFVVHVPVKGYRLYYTQPINLTYCTKTMSFTKVALGKLVNNSNENLELLDHVAHILEEHINDDTKRFTELMEHIVKYQNNVVNPLGTDIHDVTQLLRDATAKTR